MYIQDNLVDALESSKLHFVQCLLPHNTAGVSGVNEATDKDEIAHEHTKCDDVMSVPLVRSQLCGAKVLEAARLHKFGEFCAVLRPFYGI